MAVLLAAGLCLQSMAELSFAQIGTETAETALWSVAAVSNAEDSGTCGANLTWTLTDGVLRISGTGAMTDWSSQKDVPWYSEKASIQSVVLSKGVTGIGKDAFYGCTNLENVTIPEGVTSIGQSAFYNCSALTSADLPESLTSLGTYAFYGCKSLTSVTVPGGVTGSLIRTFCNCTGLETAVLEEGITSLGSSVFTGCTGLTSITLPSTLQSIGAYAFQGCSALESVVLPENLTSLGNSAFKDCTRLTWVTMPSAMTFLGGWAFENCRWLESIVVPEGVTALEECAFNGCSGLEWVFLPASLKSIGGTVFFGCSALGDVYYAGSQQDWDAVTVGNYNTDLTEAQFHWNSSALTEEIPEDSPGESTQPEDSSAEDPEDTQPDPSDPEEPAAQDPEDTQPDSSDSETQNPDDQTWEDLAVTGEAVYGSTLTVINGDSEGEYQWYRDEEAIAGATGNSYTLTGADIGTAISVRVNGTLLTAFGDGTTVSPIQLTVTGTTVEDKTYDATAEATVTPGTPVGVLEGDQVTLSAAAVFDSETVGTHTVTVTYTLSGEDAACYLAPEDEILQAAITHIHTYLDTLSTENLSEEEGWDLLIQTCSICGEVQIRTSCPTEGYPDNPRTAWYHGYVDYVVFNGIMNGTSTEELQFSPDQTMTRSQMVQLLYNLAGSPSTEGLTNPFTDVGRDWYYDAVVWAGSCGISNGNGSGQFLPDELLTREQVAQFLYNYAQAMGCGTDLTADLNFPDAGNVDEWFETAVEWAVASGLINGYGTTGMLMPAAACSRAETATMMVRFCTDVLN